jgi:ABC-type transport system substrate-binding protein
MQIYFNAQTYTLEQAPWQPLYMSVNKTAIRATIKDLKQGKSGAIYWYDAYVAK